MMEEQNFSSIQFLWWNTSLSPPGAASRSTNEHLAFVTSQLEAARELRGWDVLGLAEVNDEDIKSIIEGLGNPYLSSVEMGDRQVKAANDTAIIFDRRKLTVINDISLYDKHGSRTLKVGHAVDFTMNETGYIFRVVVSHWPGRMFYSETSDLRIQLGMSLHRSLRDFIESETPHVVLMGDFNDDPSSPSLAKHLLATRDRAFARTKPYLFYNPFWRKLGESEHHGSSDEGTCGTHYYHGGIESRWFTYDQIIFSSSFLTSKELLLDEAYSTILRLPMIADLIKRKDSIYDHYPVSGRILSRNAS